MLPILILAAGASSRMRGRDKLMMDVDGLPLLTRQVRRALAVSRDVRVALPVAPHPRHNCVAPPACKIEVADAANGIGASLRAIISTLDGASPAVLLLADLPDITSDDIAQVMTAAMDKPNAKIWRGATATGKPGHPLALHPDLFAQFQTLSGDSGGQAILSEYADSTVLVPLPGDHARRDLDTPEDWAEWRKSN